MYEKYEEVHRVTIERGDAPAPELVDLSSATLGCMVGLSGLAAMLIAMFSDSLAEGAYFLVICLSVIVAVALLLRRRPLQMPRQDGAPTYRIAEQPPTTAPTTLARGDQRVDARLTRRHGL